MVCHERIARAHRHWATDWIPSFLCELPSSIWVAVRRWTASPLTGPGINRNFVGLWRHRDRNSRSPRHVNRSDSSFAIRVGHGSRRAAAKDGHELVSSADVSTALLHNPFQPTSTDNRNTCPVPVTVHPQASFSHALDF